VDSRQRLETELSNKVVQILEPVTGQGKVRPQVSVSMNFQQVEETVEKYDPQGSVVRSQEKSQERQPKNDRVGGIPGPTPPKTTPPPAPANPAPPAAPVVQVATDPNSDAFTKQSERVNYEVSKAVRHVVNPTGKVEKLSVAVLIDNHNKIITGADGKPKSSSEPRSVEEMKKYRDLVVAAIGVNPERGDLLTVENISFEGETELIEPPTFIEKRGPMIETALRYLIIPVVFVLLYLFFLRPVKKTVFSNWAPTTAAVGTRSFPQLTGDVQTPMTVKQLEAQLRGGSGPGSDAYAAAERELLPLPSSPSKMDLIRKRVVEQAQQDPETVARLVRTWLNEKK
jgi:flagellar M-ring protein FliF